MKRHHLSSQRRAPAPIGIEDLDRILEYSGIHLHKKSLGQLWAYHNLIRKRNQGRELTRIINFESMVIKHYVDSMIVGQWMTLSYPMLDLGTGAGFPGIPLKIRYPHLKLILAEKKPGLVAFLRETCEVLSLKHVEIFEHKVTSQSFSRKVPSAITRAVEEVSKTILRTSGCLQSGSQLIFMKGPSVDPELESALKRFGDKFKVVMNKKYFLPHTPYERRLIVLERN